MKIGIITIHKSEVNYGACLQSYALWKYISNMGYECEIIDLRRPSQTGYKYKLNLSGIKAYLVLGLKLQLGKLYASLKDPKIKIRGQRYREFNNEVKYSNRYRSSADIAKNPPQYDVYISGSDQIWNPNMVFDNDPYLLSFAPYDKKRIAYASSFGVKQISQHVTDTYRKYLGQYDHISTRENGGRKLVKELIGLDVPVVLDPVFLLSAEEWKQVADRGYSIDGDYLLVYRLRNNDTLLSLAIEYAKRLNYKIILVNADYNVCRMPGVLQLRDVGPRQWLNLIQKAKLFMTDSFHGTAFAVIFGIPFLTYVDKMSKTNDRMESLLSTLGLLTHVISANENLEDAVSKVSSCDYDTLLQNAIERSKKYLADALSITTTIL